MTFTFPFTDLEINAYIVIFGLLVGALSSTFGVGGGFLLVPALNMAFGLPPKTATACSLAQMVPTSIFGIVPHWRKGNIVWLVPVIFALGAFGGIELGIMLNDYLDTCNTTIMFCSKSTPVAQIALLSVQSIVFLLQGSFLVYESIKIPKTEQGEPGIRFLKLIRPQWLKGLMIRSRENLFEPYPAPTLMLVGFLGGFFIAFLGLGGGFLAVPVFIYMVGLDTKKAVASSLFLVFLCAVWASVRNTASGRDFIDWGITLSVVLGSMIGAQLGVKINTVVKPTNIRKYFGFIILSMSVIVWVVYILRQYLAS